ncbi:hypothetical protein EYZ11_012897 [Aspergillus tanneri]|uniref:Uncharacterized protein n=1 Tax=Aspergillus tanneri TaxID=1220188 RepID=A0A4S3IZ15_9EURO|nr:uncharacterized protein ATNIH1004_004564 [Aspergillus tanneri]KAA8648679.1 hypothetical protein ATNIH1004_004564 [Aspergillus tanneri]THC87656.1 hypothetical protein EYZ11_012897 [Aspergillus tanneri]
MYSTLDGDWDVTDVTDVTVRKVNYTGDTAQKTVTRRLRLAWTRSPPCADFSDKDIWMGEEDNERCEESNPNPNPDTHTLHTPWRNRIYYLWNHLFYDASKFMSNTYGVGHLHPPNSAVLGVEFPRTYGTEDRENVRAATVVWETEVLVLPAYLAPDVVVRVETYSRGWEDGQMRDVVKLRGRFSRENWAEVWYMARGLETRFYIEGDWRPSDEDEKGLAAVMVYGKLDGDCAGKRESNDESDSEGSEN